MAETVFSRSGAVVHDGGIWGTHWKVKLLRQMRCAGCGEVLLAFTIRELRAHFGQHLARKHPSR